VFDLRGTAARRATTKLEYIDRCVIANRGARAQEPSV